MVIAPNPLLEAESLQEPAQIGKTDTPIG